MKSLQDALINKIKRDSGDDIRKDAHHTIDSLILSCFKDYQNEKDKKYSSVPNFETDFLGKLLSSRAIKWNGTLLELNLSKLPVLANLKILFIDYVKMYEQCNIKNVIFTGDCKYMIYLYGNVIPSNVSVNIEYKNPNKMMDCIIPGNMRIEPSTQDLKYKFKNVKYNLINRHHYPVLDDYIWALGAENYYKLGNYLSVGGYLPTDVLLNHEDIRNIQQNTEFYKNLWDNHKISQLLTNDYIYGIILEKLKKYGYFPFSDIKKASNSNEFDKTQWDLEQFEIDFYAPNRSTGKKLAQQFIKDASTPVNSYQIIKDFIVLYCK